MKIVLIIGCILISVAAVAQQSVTISFDAALIVENDVEIKTRLTGIIAKIYVDRGVTVKKGDPLAELDNQDLKLEIRRAEVRLEETRSENDRAKSLHDQKLMSDSDYDSKRLSFEQAAAELEIAKVNYEKSIIRAPFNGIVSERYLKVGQRVVEDDDIVLFRITAMEPLLARVFVPEAKLGDLSQGAKSEFVPSTHPDLKFSARVKWISSTIDPASGTAPVLVELNPVQKKGVLRPGTSGKVTIWINPAKSVASN